MKTLQKIEKTKTLWIIFFILLTFLLLRLPSLIEPLWYGDEGIYQVIGQALNNGKQLYSQIWDNKPPLLYLLYAFFHSDQFSLRFLSLCFGIVSAAVFLFFSKTIFNSFKIPLVTTSTFVILFASPLIEGNIANAENFMILPITLAALLIYNITQTKKTTASSTHKFLILDSNFLILFSAGLLLGLAFLLKTVAVFDFSAFLIFLIFTLLPEKFSIQKYKSLFPEIITKLFFFISGFFLPLGLTSIYFLTQGTLPDFINAVFLSNIDYVGYKNSLLFPQGVLFIKIILLIIAISLIYRKRNNLPREALFIYLWFIFSLFNTLFSGRPWIHYLLVTVPSASLMLGLIFYTKTKYLKNSAALFLTLLLLVAVYLFNINFRTVTKSITYYQNFILFSSGHKSLDSYRNFFDNNVTRDYDIARFINSKTLRGDKIFIWGNNPQIYLMTQKSPPGRYTVEYHISASPGTISETARALEQHKPKYIIILSEFPPYPFALKNYIHKLNINNARIYEITL